MKLFFRVLIDISIPIAACLFSYKVGFFYGRVEGAKEAALFIEKGK